MDEDASIDNRRWMWMHYGTAYRAIYTMLLGVHSQVPGV